MWGGFRIPAGGSECGSKVVVKADGEADPIPLRRLCSTSLRGQYGVWGSTGEWPRPFSTLVKYN